MTFHAAAVVNFHEAVAEATTGLGWEETGWTAWGPGHEAARCSTRSCSVHFTLHSRCTRNLWCNSSWRESSLKYLCVCDDIRCNITVLQA